MSRSRRPVGRTPEGFLILSVAQAATRPGKPSPASPVRTYELGRCMLLGAKPGVALRGKTR